MSQMRITGFASGLDIDQIVRDLMTAERVPVDKLFQKKEWLQWQRDAYRDVNLELDTFRKQADKLRFQYNFNGYKAEASDSGIATATAKTNAVPGSYNLTVNSLAEVARVKTGSTILNTAGTAAKSTDKVLGSGGTASIEVSTLKGTAKIDINENDTFASLATKIAGATDSTSGESLGLRASFDDTTSTFVISTKEMGSQQKITLSDITGGTESVQNLAAFIKNGGSFSDAGNTPLAASTVNGKDGSIMFDGTTINGLTSNKVSVYGVDLTLSGKGSTTVNIQSDTDSIFNNIKTFVDEYNKLIDSLSKKIKEPRNKDFAPLTDEQRDALTEKEAEKWDEKSKSGLLYNDQLLRDTLFNLRQKIYSPVGSVPDGQLKLLSQIGIKPPSMSRDGKLEIDEEKLRDAIANKPDEVAKMFTASDGIGTRIYDEINKSIDKLNKKAGRPDTSPNLDISNIGKSISDVSKQMDSWTDKLKRIEDRYWKQFTSMETALSKMNEQSNYLMGMMGS